MVLKQLELFRFKRFLEKKITFAPGLNIIRGPNESGKSTVRAALTTALFGNPTSNSEAVRAVITWGQTERCELRLEYHDDENRWCQLRKDFAANKIFMIRGEESLRTLKGIQNQITEAMGIPSEELFNLCTSLDVRSLANLGSQASRKQIGKMLAGLMTGTSSGPDVLQALKRLDEAIRELGKGERSAAVKNPGPLKTLRDHLLQLQNRRQQERKALQTHQERMRHFEKLKVEGEALRSRLAGLEHLMEANNKLQTAKTRKQELVLQDTDFEKRMQEQQKLESELEMLSQTLQKNPLRVFSSQDIEHLRSLQLRQQQLENEEPQPPGATAQSPWLWGLGTLLGLIGLSLLFFEWVVAMLVLLSSAGIIITGIIQQSSKKEKLRQHEKELVKWQDKQLQLTNEIAAIRQRVENQSMEQILQQWPQTQQHLLEKTSLHKRLETFSAPEAERWQTIRRELRLLEDTLNDPALNTLALAPEALAARQREAQKLNLDLSELMSEKNKVQALLENAQTNHDTVAELEEQIAEAQGRITGLEKQERLFCLTHDLLDQARRDTLNPARKVLEKRAGELMAIFSCGRYQHIAVDDEDLSSKILLPETGVWEEPAVVSQGTFDQFFLSLRLALSEVLAGGKRVPIFLDEPLAAFDPERARATLNCFKALAKDRQIFLFTCRPDYDKAADKVIEL